MKIREIEAKSILVSSKLPDTDYVINPYVGCIFGCAYCYASFMGRFVGESFENWGKYLSAKINAPELLDKELKSLSLKKRNSRVLLSSVTDPYQYAERNYMLTRRILDTFVKHNYAGRISILTKSPLVVRDIDLLQKLKSVEVGFTITTTNDIVSREFEVRAPLASARLAALKIVSDAGINTYAFIGPLLPHFYDQPKLLEDLFSAVAATGVKTVYVEHMNLKAYIRGRLVKMLSSERPDAPELYSKKREETARKQMNDIVRECMKRHGLTLRLGKVLVHGE